MLFGNDKDLEALRSGIREQERAARFARLRLCVTKVTQLPLDYF